MEDKLTNILWYPNSHFIKEEYLFLDFPEILNPKSIGELFQLTSSTKIKDKGSNLNENIENTLNEFVKVNFPDANDYSEAVISMNGFYKRIYQLYVL